jgi:hypothetical protein
VYDIRALRAVPILRASYVDATSVVLKSKSIAITVPVHDD